jgi:hypothetical protein
MPYHRTGKIARLPKELRDVVNEMLFDGAKYRHIIESLNNHKKLWPAGLDEITEDNLTNWFQGGYQDFLQERERLQEMAVRREFAMETVKQNAGSQVHEATLLLAASQMYEALTEFDLGALKTLLREKPENYAPLVNSLAKLSEKALAQQKYRDEVREKRDKILELTQAAKAPGGLTPETLKAIEEAAGLL